MEVIKRNKFLKFEYTEEYTTFYDFDLISDDKVLTIYYDGKANLHMMLKTDADNKFYISKDDDAIFIAFDSLYRNIIDGKPLGNYTPINDYKGLSIQYGIVDKKKRIFWLSDDDSNNSLLINKDKDTYELQFNSNLDTNTIDVVFNGYDSKKYPFNSPFILLYQQLQNICPMYRMNVDEIKYQKTLKHIS